MEKNIIDNNKKSQSPTNGCHIKLINDVPVDKIFTATSNDIPINIGKLSTKDTNDEEITASTNTTTTTTATITSTNQQTDNVAGCAHYKRKAKFVVSIKLKKKNKFKLIPLLSIKINSNRESRDYK